MFVQKYFYLQYRASILSRKYQFSLPGGAIILISVPTQPTFNTRGAVAAGSEKGAYVR